MSSTIVSNISKSVITSITTTGHLLNTSSVKWSQNNWIAIIIDKYIYVLSSRLDPNESTQNLFPYHKSIIANPNQNLIFDCDIDVRQLITSSSLDEQHLLMLDPTLVIETANGANFLSYRSVEWSPISSQFGCLLGALTLDHRLVIFRKEVDVWEPIIDLSLLLNEKMKEFWPTVGSPNYLIYRERVYTLATTAFCWGTNWVQNTRENSSDKTSISCALYMGSKNGLVSFWNITIGQQINTKLVYKWKTNSDQIICLKSFEEFLIISSYNGLVSLIYSGFSVEEMPNTLCLWSEEDMIGVNHLAVKAIDRNSFDILFTKSSFIIICRFTADKIGDNITMNLKCCKTVMGLHQMPSTGICSIIDSKYLMTSMDGRLIEIDVSLDLSVSQSEVTLDSVSSSAMCSYGIDCSPNGTLSALVQTLSVYHDHLAIKEPLQIVVFSNITFDYLTNILYEKYLCENPIAKNAVIEECFDYMDCVRAFLSKSQYSTFDTFLFSLIDNQNLIISCNDLIKLKLIRFITRAYLTNIKTKVDNICTRLEANALLCEDMILKLYIQELYNDIICNQNNTSRLNEIQLLSLKHMNSWLLLRFNFQLIDKNYFNFESIGPELCPICNQQIVFQFRGSDMCPNGHHFHRCANSLILCDFANHKYEKCFRCMKSLLIKPSIWKQSPICLYCI